MNYRKKATIQKTLFFVMTMLGFILCGGFVGYLLGTFQKAKGAAPTAPELLIMMVLGIVGIMLLYYVQIYCHELGHVLFGLLTGYRFSSIRFGSLMLMKTEGKLRLKKHAVAHTGGQALMLPPEGKGTDFPVLWYNIGGLVINLLLSGLGLWGWLVMPKSSVLITIPAACMITGLVVMITNGIPLSEIGTDGANALVLMKSKDARLAFRNMLELNAMLANNVPLDEMPEALFAFDDSTPLDNPLVTGQAVNHFTHLVVHQQWEEAIAAGEQILREASSINELHELDLHLELVYLYLVARGDTAAAKAIMEQHGKRLKAMVSQPLYHRCLYAYHQLCEGQPEQAAACKSAFEKLAVHYPYPSDIQAERNLFAVVDELISQQT